MAAASRSRFARRQRGAAAVFAAISIIGGLIATGLAIDLGRLYYSQRDLQRLANMAALDSVRIAGGCRGETDDAGAATLAEALLSVQRNGGQAAWVQNAAADILGRMEIEAGLRRFEQPTVSGNRAVQVRISRPAPARLIPLLSGGGSVTLTALSAAYNTPSALVKVGSRLANFDPADGGTLDDLFAGLVGGPVSLDALSYEALFDAQVPLGGILDNLDLGPDGDSADTPTSLGDFILATINELGDPAAIAAAQAMYDAADGSRTVIPSQVLGVDDPASPGFTSAGDILTAAAAASLDDTPITIPIDLPPPLGPGSSNLRLLDSGAPTRLQPGGVAEDQQNFAHNTSLLLETHSPIDLGELGLSGDLTFFVQAGQSTATADSIRCARRGEPTDRVDVTATSSITRIGIGRFDDINAPHPQPQPVIVLDGQQGLLPVDLGLLGGLVQVPVKITITAGAFVDIGQSDSESFDNMVKGETRRLGTPGATSLALALAAIPGNLDVDVDIEVLGAQPALIQNLINGAVSRLDVSLANTVSRAIAETLLARLDAVLGPQLEMLGVTIGGADVSVLDILADEPLLFTH